MRIALHCGLPHAEYLWERLTHRQWAELRWFVSHEPVGTIADARIAAKMLEYFIAGKGIDPPAPDELLSSLGFRAPDEAQCNEPPQRDLAAASAMLRARFASLGCVGL